MAFIGPSWAWFRVLVRGQQMPVKTISTKTGTATFVGHSSGAVTVYVLVTGEQVPVRRRCRTRREADAWLKQAYPNVWPVPVEVFRAKVRAAWGPFGMPKSMERQMP